MLPEQQEQPPQQVQELQQQEALELLAPQLPERLPLAVPMVG